MTNMLYISWLSLACLVSHLAIGRKIFSPGVVHGAIWLTVSLGYVFILGELSVVSTKTLFVLMVGIIAFSIGIHVGEQLNGQDLPRRDSTSARQFPVPLLVVIVSAIGLAMMMNRAFEYMPINSASSWFGGNDSWYAGLRYELNMNRGGSFGLASYVLNFSFAGTVYLVLYARRLYLTVWFWSSLALSLGFAFLSTGRTHLVLLGCMVVAAALPTSKRKRQAFALLLPLLGGAILVLVTFMSGRLDTASSGTLLASLANRHLKGYILTPVGALDILVNSELPATGGSMTFRTPLEVLRFLGVPVNVPELLQPNVTFAGFVVNIYTGFSPYYRDFGLVGVGLFMAMLGGLHGWVFRQLKTGLPIFSVANALLFYALLMQFFQDQYFSLMSQWVQILSWTYLFAKLQPLPNTAASGQIRARVI